MTTVSKWQVEEGGRIATIDLGVGGRGEGRVVCEDAGLAVLGRNG